MAGTLGPSDLPDIRNILKVYYKDGIESLLKRNDPLLRAIDFDRIEGKTYNFATIYGHGGAVSADALIASSKAASTSKNAEWSVETGQLFSSWSYNIKEMLASATSRGAYQKAIANKAFGGAEAFRKALAASLYGSGYGELAVLSDAVALTGDNSTVSEIPVPSNVLQSVDADLDLVIKPSISSSTINATVTVKKVNQNSISVTSNTTYTTADGDVICLAGSMDGNGKGICPMGLGGWLPVVEGRSGTNWQNYISQSFFGVNRSVNPEKLAGGFVVGANGESMVDTVMRAIDKARQAGGDAQYKLYINNKDWLKLSKEIQTTNTYFTQTSTREKRKAVLGYSSFAADFNTSSISSIEDTPYIPEGKFYVLDLDTIGYVVYSNPKKVDDGVVDNEPGRADPDSESGEDREFKLNIDDVLSVTPAARTSDGNAALVDLFFFGSLAIFNPANNVVGLFYNADGYDHVLGYKY